MTPEPRRHGVIEPAVQPCESAAEIEIETTVREVMLANPKTLSADASIAEARAALGNDHVHMVLLTEGRTLGGTLTRTDLPPAGSDGLALFWSTLSGRTVSPETPTRVVQDLLIERGLRRVAVVDADGSLLGLVCLKRRRTGFCSEADVVSRSRSHDTVATQSVQVDVGSQRKEP